jgi:hypothetical protein
LTLSEEMRTIWTLAIGEKGLRTIGGPYSSKRRKGPAIGAYKDSEDNTSQDPGNGNHLITDAYYKRTKIEPGK